LITEDVIVSGIGHKIKSVNNPDLRVELVKEYVHKHFPSHTLLDYALAVEKVTTAKKDTVSIISAALRTLYAEFCPS
jgi:ATP citrate (pro-S)-lyase